MNHLLLDTACNIYVALLEDEVSKKDNKIMVVTTTYGKYFGVTPLSVENYNSKGKEIE